MQASVWYLVNTCTSLIANQIQIRACLFCVQLTSDDLWRSEIWFKQLVIAYVLWSAQSMNYFVDILMCFLTATLGTLDFSLLYDQENNALHCTINKAKVRTFLGNEHV